MKNKLSFPDKTKEEEIHKFQFFTDQRKNIYAFILVSAQWVVKKMKFAVKHYFEFISESEITLRLSITDP
jgi:hypothetical protein